MVVDPLEGLDTLVVEVVDILEVLKEFADRLGETRVQNSELMGLK